MNARPPLAERTLPLESAARIRASLLADAAADRPARRGWRTALVAAAIVLVLLGVTFAVWNRPATQLVAGPAPNPADLVVSTDLGPLDAVETEAQLADCRRDEHAPVEEVLYARRLTDGTSSIRSVIYRNTEGQITLCSGNLYGPTRGAERAYRPSERYPVMPLTGIASAGWLPDQTTSTPTIATDYETFQPFAAADDVATVQLRAVVEGRPGPWFVGTVVNGFVIVPLVAAGPVPLDAHGEPQLTFERRGVDGNGRLVAVK